MCKTEKLTPHDRNLLGSLRSICSSCKFYHDANSSAIENFNFNAVLIYDVLFWIVT